MNEQVLENLYREHLEESIVFCLSERKKISPEEAMRLYYSSNLSNLIYHGTEGIQYLDYKLLVDYLEKDIEKTSRS